MTRQEEEVHRNYEAFEAQLPALVQAHGGKFALMRDGKIVELFDTVRDAYLAGRALFEADGVFSVQEVVSGPVDLGFFSQALP